MKLTQKIIARHKDIERLISMVQHDEYLLLQKQKSVLDLMESTQSTVGSNWHHTGKPYWQTLPWGNRMIDCGHLHRFLFFVPILNISARTWQSIIRSYSFSHRSGRPCICAQISCLGIFAIAFLRAYPTLYCGSMKKNVVSYLPSPILLLLLSSIKPGSLRYNLGHFFASAFPPLICLRPRPSQPRKPSLKLHCSVMANLHTSFQLAILINEMF